MCVERRRARCGRRRKKRDQDEEAEMKHAMMQKALDAQAAKK